MDKYSKNYITQRKNELMDEKVELVKAGTFVYTERHKEIDLELKDLAAHCNHKKEDNTFAFNPANNMCEYCGHIRKEGEE